MKSMGLPGAGQHDVDGDGEVGHARIRGVAADSAVGGLVDRGLIAEAGREHGGAIRYGTTPLFERVFGLQGLSELPRLDDLAGDAEELRARLEEVAGRRGA